jgi:hypothetical protein
MNLVLAGLVVQAAVTEAQETPDIIDYRDGQITWTNVNPALYYSIEWLADLTSTNWTSSFRSLQDLQSSASTLTADVPMFYRIVGSTNAVNTHSLSPLTPVVVEGYYAATNLTEVDADLAAGNLARDVEVYGVVGTAIVATGDATEAQVLEEATFSVAGASGLTGTMANIGAIIITPGTTEQAIVEGYHDGSGAVAGDVNLNTENIRAGATIFGVAGKAEVVDTTSGDATADDLLEGKKAWVNGAEVTGVISTYTLSADTNSVLAGFYGATNLSDVDADLASGNIHAGVAVFGVPGKPEVVDTTSGDATADDLAEGKVAWVDGAQVTGSRTPAPVPKTGQLNTFRTGDDGDLEKGIASPDPRFTAQSDGAVVQDILTGLMWTSDANLGGPKDWGSAVDFCQALDHGGYSDWRLPNIRELQSLIDFGRFDPALPSGHPFTGWQPDNYWSGTMLADPSGDAWYMRLTDGYIDVSGTTALHYVWPVRGGP